MSDLTDYLTSIVRARLYDSIIVASVLDSIHGYRDLKTILLAAVVLGIVYLCIYNTFFHPLAHVPGPLSAKILPLWTIKALYKANLCPELAKLHAHHGPIVRTGPNEVSFTSIRAFDTIYRIPHTKGNSGHYFSKDGTLQDGIANLIFRASTIGTEGDRIKHRQLRNRMAPAFSPDATFAQQATQQVHLDRMFEDIDERIRSGKPIDLRDHFSKMLWNMVSELSFGEPLVSSKRETFIRMETAYRKTFPFLELVNNVFPWVERLIFYASDLVPAASARAFLPTGDLKKCMDRQDNRQDFLSAIMGQMGKSEKLGDLDWDLLYSNASFFIVSGYFTNEISHAALTYNLLRNPDSMNKLKREIRESFDSLEEIDGKTIARLPYLNACVSESLRLLPPLAGKFMSRRSPGACIDGLWVPFGTQVFVDGYVVQRSPNNFADPDDFRPERFLHRGKGSKYEHDVHEAYKPFSAGPRTCIGRELALQSLKLSVAKLLWNYDMSFADGMAFVWEQDCKSSALWADYRLRVQMAPRSDQ